MHGLVKKNAALWNLCPVLYVLEQSVSICSIQTWHYETVVKGLLKVLKVSFLNFKDFTFILLSKNGFLKINFESNLPI